MIESLIGGLLGGGTRLAQSWMSLKEKKLEAEHEFRMLELNIRLDAQRAAAALDQARVEAASAETRGELDALIAATNAQAKPSGIRWIDGLSASVRPVLAYWYCVASYGVYKASVLLALPPGTPFTDVGAAMWTEHDISVSSSVLAFFLVDRSLRKMGRS